MTLPIPLKCVCGSLRGTARGVTPFRSNRVICLCDDCQTYAHALGQAKEILDENGGTDIFPLAPADIEITKGIEHLRALRLSPKGILRWYADCCKTAIANTPASPRMPYVGVLTDRFDFSGTGTTRDRALGPVRGRIQGRYGIGRLPAGTHPKAPLVVIARIAKFILLAKLKHRQSPSPFFTAEKQPIVEPRVLSIAERNELRKLCGPSPHKAAID